MSQCKKVPVADQVIRPNPLALLIHYFFTGNIYSTVYIVDGILSFDASVFKEHRRRMRINNARLSGMSKKKARKFVDKFELAILE